MIAVDSGLAPAAPCPLPAEGQTELRDLPAPAKLNLFLHVTGRRPDGYHLLQTVFTFVTLHDTVHLRRREDGLVQRVSALDGVPSDACLTVRAARALQAATGCAFGVDIALDKRVPAGGGLGGGSSDAATVLLGLNRLWGTGLSREALMAIALPLGADVPVFVGGTAAFAEGVGERLQPLTLTPAWYVVVQPHAHVPTAAVFGDPCLTRDSSVVRIADFPTQHSLSPVDENADAGNRSKGIDPVALSRFGRNDLESVVFSRFSQVEQARQIMAQAVQRIGRQAGDVRMSGSGACLFVACDSQQQADTLKAEIAATIRASDEAAKAAPANAIQAITVCAGIDKHPLQHWAE
ncbi:4-(cytidine 5'-diphospho)-2-C-methyl-D-erythritol kinase [Achromobacter sp. GG226]|uniref:4-(cytidine 5'-diphospho)-2-C-methyl-D-erythritol kinase n=1 Tax=Verticiella alkaliphila TaxID=2779529 RepID=UPI001C0C1124|nr:4-(cytidine 5'-diphospho)-2-C-methyl-D-erythritol kinase [Verticiella sp. GG226]MBU4612108.1 4-(cytidine 5'-diphospho)-2-C-methyl-D-erythritol kinase [Verticiella sp. GG226]